MATKMGLSIVHDRRCPRCNGALFLKKGCRAWANRGFRYVAKCLRGCGHEEGYVATGR